MDLQEAKDYKVSQDLKVHRVSLVLKENGDFLDPREHKATLVP